MSRDNPPAAANAPVDDDVITVVAIIFKLRPRQYNIGPVSDEVDALVRAMIDGDADWPTDTGGIVITSNGG